ncbi:MAG TPA: TadE/TadG family type IV pilus assembly protein [Candidatus Dormibacteraeota bacterium]|jgi:Flp pilus assembly protein TadG|nr:TadE/TadG family type IV pilus assembly protein [Candidatus Dormibacteraeota bacterium]
MRRGRRAERGQAMILLAVSFLIMLGFAGMAIDAGHDYLLRRSAQNAMDSAALASAKQLAVGGKRQTAPPASSNDLSMEAINQFATNNGFATTRSTTCDRTTGTGATATFSATWNDASSCASTSGWTTKITVNVPPSGAGGVSIPPDCLGTYQFNCVQVTLVRIVTNYLGGIVGIPTTTITVSAVSYAQPPGALIGTPPAVAMLLYEPSASFNTAAAPSHAQLNCGNCPTFWTAPPTSASKNVVFDGVNGGTISGGPLDTVSLQSAGHMVMQASTTICDPYNGTQGGQPVACPGNTAVGSLGFAIANGATAYCTTPLQGTATGLTPCTSPGPGAAGLDKLYANETAYSAQTYTAPIPDLSGLTDCEGIVLNGETVTSHNLTGNCQPDASEPYTIMPGKYQYIVINHGTYDFAPGLFDIYGTAPVNSASGSGYRANGIDHSLETASDFDLCSGVANCAVTAGVWIGHGGGSFGALSAGTPMGCGSGAAGVQGGGGDATIVSGTNVSFYFAANGGNPKANAFVSTNEVATINLTSPGLNANKAVNDLPILFDNENSGFIHLDSAAGTSAANKGDDEGDGQGPVAFSPSGFSGIIYQKPSATSGGVELDPSLSGGQANAPGAITGQVMAYSLTTFGGAGTAVDFSVGYGQSTQPQIGTSGNNEAQIIGTPAPSVAASSRSGWETFTLNYTDEWAMDAYDVYVKVNGGNPVFFSKGIWSSAPGAGAVLPPNPNTPGDSNPARPNRAAASTGSVVGGNGTYATKKNPGTGQFDDWTFTYADGSTMEVLGQWTWGHERDIVNAVSGTNTASIKYTFPTPTGQSVNIQIFMTDGDRCGDYATANYTFNNVGVPNAGQQTSGTVQLEG